jgi:DNA-binding HxlR family transcriptional regulator
MEKETIEAIKEVFGGKDKVLILWQVKEGDVEPYEIMMKEEKDESIHNSKGI